MMVLQSYLRNYKKQILSFEGEPQFIARGFALGSFIGMLPIPGFHILTSLGLAFLFKLNKKSVFLGVIKTNFFTAGFIFSFNYWVGKELLGIQPEFVISDIFSSSFLSEFFAAGLDVFLCLTMGGILMGIVSAVINYYIVFVWIRNYRNYAVR